MSIPMQSSTARFFTSADRDQMIDRAQNSKSYRGYSGPYQYHLITKLSGTPDAGSDDPKKAIATEALAEVLYRRNPRFRVLSQGIYALLMERLRIDPFIAKFLYHDVFVLFKGSNAYAMLSNEHPELPFSDLDIAIYINPFLHQPLFDDIFKHIQIIVFQALSSHKKLIDNMFFTENPDLSIKYKLFGDAEIEEFKKSHVETYRKFGLISPFENKDIRNFCSRNSFMLVPSNIHDNKVVNVEVPHFNKCDRIPLRKSPVFCSYNQTIQFSNDVYTRNFDLSRMRFNGAIEVPADQVEVEIVADEEIGGQVQLKVFGLFKNERASADFIDITLAHQNDSELIDFWLKGRAIFVKHALCETWLTLPCLETCIHDLEKMLNIYDCPESKREKREKRLTLLRGLLAQKHCLA